MITIQQVREYLSVKEKPVQLVKHFDEVPSNKLSWPAQAEVKEDGVYCLVVCASDGVGFFSRTGGEFYYENATATLNIPPNVSQSVFITELINPATHLEALSGLVNPNRVKAWTAEERKLMFMNARLKYHDVIGLEDFMKGSCAKSFGQRSGFLVHAVPEIWCVQNKLVYSEEEFREYAQGIIDAGGEGATLKQLAADYEAGHKGWRTTKIVRDIHVDLQCTAVKYGKPGKHQHWIAALEFEYKGRKFWADLGKGWDNEKREYLTRGYEKNRWNVIGQIFHVKALMQSSRGVLRLPKVEEQRFDKEQPDE